MTKIKNLKILEATALFLSISLLISGAYLVLGKNQKLTNTQAAVKPIAKALNLNHENNNKAKYSMTDLKTDSELENVTDALEEELLLSDITQGLDSVSPEALKSLKNADNLFELKYPKDDEIKISADQTPQQYFQETAKILNFKFNHLSENELDIIVRALKTSQYNLLEPYKKSYEESYKEILKVEVPQDLAPLHKKQLAIYQALQNLLSAVQNSESDPVKSLVALSYYPKIISEANSLIKDLYAAYKNYN